MSPNCSRRSGGDISGREFGFRVCWCYFADWFTSGKERGAEQRI
jgi:hypothetical protein